MCPQNSSKVAVDGTPNARESASPFWAEVMPESSSAFFQSMMKKLAFELERCQDRVATLEQVNEVQKFAIKSMNTRMSKKADMKEAFKVQDRYVKPRCFLSMQQPFFIGTNLRHNLFSFCVEKSKR